MTNLLNIDWNISVVTFECQSCIATSLKCRCHPSTRIEEQSHEQRRKLMPRNETPIKASRGRLVDLLQGSRRGIHRTLRAHESAICATPQEQLPSVSTVVFNVNIVRCRQQGIINIAMFDPHSSPPRAADLLFHRWSSKIEKGTGVLEIEPPIMHDAASCCSAGC